ncbi:MAG: filamentous hemagglutinin N-terminal domain-containing protein [Sulfurospirillaceae bacterium]|nr:filamentous hemagglutinin N-terminal domain-containing protein [Sulfurospirillaceae bacterium]MDD2826595.1 filamentous hemagglutinin N-terminal domain-containing protein [Sulfurospirillaceae bacterium]
MNYRPDYNSRFRILKGGKISLVISALITGTTLCFAAPSGGVVSSGSASIAQSGSVTNITQTTHKAAINWQNFSIGTNEAVTFNQPSTSSITLNRVVGNEKSIIDGALNANGQVWILNANGLLFSKNASINTAGLIATTMNLSDADFQAGNYTFKGDSSASIINQGTINISDKGYAALFGAEVRNGGIIKATLGKVELTGAKEVTLNLNGNSMVSLTVNKGVLDALVENKGAIYADGGEVYLTTNAVDELLRGVVNNTGIVEANSIDDITGKIELYAHGGALHVEGTLEAKNGFIETSGKAFSVADETIVKAKTWLIDPTDMTISDASAYNTALNGGTDVTITTDGYIVLFSLISKTSGTDATLTLKAGGDIFIYSDITSISNKLNTVLWADADGNGAGRVQIGLGGPGTAIDTYGGHLWIGGGSGTATWHGLTVGNGAATSANFNGVTLMDFSSLASSGGDIFIKGAYTGTSDNVRGVDLVGDTITSGAGNIEISGTNSGTGANNHGIFSASSITSTTGSITLTGTTASTSAYGIDQFSPISSGSGDIALNADRLNLIGSVILASTGKLSIAPTTAGTAIGIGTSRTLYLPSSYFSTNFQNSFSGITIGSATAGTITIDGTTTYNDTLTLKTAGDIMMNGGTLAGVAGENASLVLWADADGNGEGRVEIGNNIMGVASINTHGGHLWIGGGSGTATWHGLTVGNGAATSANLYGVTLMNFSSLTSDGGDIFIKGAYTGILDNFDGVELYPSSSINSGAGNIEISGTNSGTGANNHGIFSYSSITSTTGSITLTGTTASTSTYGIYQFSPISSGSGDIALNADRLKFETANATLSTGTGTITLRSDEFVNATGLSAPFSAALTTIYLPSHTDATLNGLTVDDKRYNTTYAGGCLSAGCTLPTTGVNLLYAEAPVLTVSPTSGQTSTYGDSFSASGYTVSGFIDGDDVASSGISGTAVYTLGGTLSGSGHWVAGSHDIAYSSGLASQLGYTFADDTSVNNELSIAKRPVNISVAKNYNGNADFTTGFTLGNIVSGETVSIDSGSATVSSANTGSYTSFTTNTLSLSDANNYTLTGGSVSATISPALGPTPEELAAIEAARIAAEQEAARLAAIEAAHIATLNAKREFNFHSKENALPPLNFTHGSIRLPDGLEEDPLLEKQSL